MAGLICGHGLLLVGGTRRASSGSVEPVFGQAEEVVAVDLQVVRLHDGLVNLRASSLSRASLRKGDSVDRMKHPLPACVSMAPCRSSSA